MIQTQCFDCQAYYDGKQTVAMCPTCQGPLVCSPVMQDYLGQLPIRYGIDMTTCCGNTAIVQLAPTLFAKREMDNPTGSFKDRGTLYELLFAKDNGYTDLICASTGNMAVSLAYWAQQLEIQATILVPSTTPAARVAKMKQYQASIELIDDNYDVCAMMAKTQTDKNETTLLAGDYCIRRYGQQSCGTEIALYDQLFDYVFCPVGNGTFFNAVVEGFVTHASTARQQYTTFVGVQGEGCAPLYDARCTQQDREPIQEPQTIGAYFKVGNPGEGNIVMDYMQRYDYLLDQVSDQAMRDAQQSLGKVYDIQTCYTSASTYASYQQQKIKTKQTTSLLLLTG